MKPPRAPAAVVIAPLVLCVVCAKVALPVKANSEIGLPLLLLPALALVGFAVGRLRLAADRLLVLLFMLATLYAIQVLAIGEYSPASLAMMTVLFSTYALGLPQAAQSTSQHAAALEFFLRFALAMAVLGIAQFALQFVVPRDVAFPVEALLRHAGLLIEGFNYQIPLRYQSPILKSNGVFFLEPSFYSQFLAVAIVAELVTRCRARALAVYAIAYATTYSGTGAMILAVCLPLFVVSRRRWDLVAAAVVAVLAVLPFHEALHLDIFIERAGEFGSPGTSGFERFVGGFYMFDAFLSEDPLRALLGYGAGSFRYWVHKSPLPATELAFFKIVFEFGLVGSLAFFGFVIYCVASSPAPMLLRVAIGVSYLLNGMYVPSSHGLALTLLLWPSSGPVRELHLLPRRAPPSYAG